MKFEYEREDVTLLSLVNGEKVIGAIVQKLTTDHFMVIYAPYFITEEQATGKVLVQPYETMSDATTSVFMTNAIVSMSIPKGEIVDAYDALLKGEHVEPEETPVEEEKEEQPALTKVRKVLH